MARIPDISAVGPQRWSAPTKMVSYDASAFSAGSRSQAAIGKAIADAGQALGGLLSAAGSANEKAEDYRLQTQIVDHGLKLDDEIREMERNISETGEGYRQQVSEYVDRRHREFFSGVPEAQRGRYDLTLRRDAAQRERRARELEYSQADQYYTRDVATRTDGLRAQIGQNPDDAQKYIEEGLKIIQSSPLPTRRKEEEIRKFGRAAEQDYTKVRVADIARRASLPPEDPDYLSQDDAATKFKEIEDDIRARVRPTWETAAGSRGGALRGPTASFDPSVESAIQRASQDTGLDVGLLRTIVQIESTGNAALQNAGSSYKGLFQLSDDDFVRFGGKGDIFNPDANALAGARKIKWLADRFQSQFGRTPTATDIYLMHQQGEGGYAAHLKNPDQPAWRSMAATAEGRQKGENWAKQAIWGNVPDDMKSRYNRETMTSREFVEMWDDKVSRIGGATGTAVAGGPRPERATDFLKGKLAPGYESRADRVERLHPVMQDRLAAFLSAAEDAGHDIRALSLYRTPEEQRVLWERALRKYGSAEVARRHVAPPGGSSHESGEAVDLQYQDRGAGLGGKRTAAVAWAHENARKFGLHFPLGHEDWHIEPIEARAGGRRYGGSYASTRKPLYQGGGARPQLAAPVSRPISERGVTSLSGLRPSGRTDVASDASPAASDNTAPSSNAPAPAPAPQSAVEIAMEFLSPEQRSKVDKSDLGAMVTAFADTALKDLPGASQQHLARIKERYAFARITPDMTVREAIKAAQQAGRQEDELIARAVAAQAANSTANPVSTPSASAGQPPESATGSAAVVPVQRGSAPMGGDEPSPGQIEAGDIDLSEAVFKNKDDTLIIRIKGGQHVIIPQVRDGKLVSWTEAVEEYTRTGKHVGKFDTDQNAHAFRQARLERQARRVESGAGESGDLPEQSGDGPDTDPANDNPPPPSTTAGDVTSVESGAAYAAASGPRQISTLLDGIPDRTKLSSLPPDVRAKVLELLPPDVEKQFQMPDGSRRSALDEIEVGAIKRAMEATLRQEEEAKAEAGVAPQATPGKPRFQYRFMTETEANAQVETLRTAQRAMFIDPKHGAIANEVAHVLETGEMRVDKNGRTVLDRAAGVLTPNQLIRESMKIEAAKQAHRYLKPLPTMTEDEMDAVITELSPDPNDPPHKAGMKAALLKRAEPIIKRQIELRQNDPAAAADMAPEVRNVHKKIGQIQEKLRGVTLGSGNDNNPIAQILESTRFSMEGTNNMLADPEAGVADPNMMAVQTAWGAVFEARTAAQERFNPTEPVRLLTNAEARRLLGIPKRATVSDREFTALLKGAADRAERQFGKKYAAQAFKEAVSVIIKNSAQENEAASMVTKIIRGERVSAMEVNRLNSLNSLDQISRTFSPQWEQTTVSPMMQPPVAAPSTPGSFSNAEMAARLPNQAHKDWLRKNPDQWQVFDQKFGRGAASIVLQPPKKASGSSWWPF